MAVVLEVEAEMAGPDALKVMLPTAQQDEVAPVPTEFRALSRLDHPGVLRVFESGVVETDRGSSWNSWRPRTPGGRGGLEGFRRQSGMPVRVK